MTRPAGDDVLADVLERRARDRFGPLLAGVDEAGRGPLAGPLLVAAVILPPATPGIGALADSKRLSPADRESLARWVRQVAVAWSVWRVGSRTIDREGIGHSVQRAMARSVEALAVRPAAALVDGPFAPAVQGVVLCPVVDGDRLCPSVMAAAILAKTARDREMLRWHGMFPAYGFDAHKGYATAQHRRRIDEAGPCPIHRRSFLSALGERSGPQLPPYQRAPM